MAVALIGNHKWAAKAVAASMQRFQCTVCYERVTKPIITCKTQHFICRECSQKLPDCPLCHKDFSAEGNIALNNILEESVFPCANKKDGCKTMMVYYEIIAHEEKSCNYKMIPCCLNCDLTNAPCQEIPLLHEYKLHVENQHKRREKILSSEELSRDIAFEVGRDIRTMELIEVFDENLGRSMFFVEKILYSGQLQMFCISFHFIGRVEQAKNYTYTIRMTDSKDPNIYFTQKNHCLQVGLSEEHIQSSGRALVICMKSLMSSLERRKLLKYSVKFEYACNEKKYFKKYESEKKMKKNLCKEEFQNDENENEKKNLDEKIAAEEKPKEKAVNEENETEEDYEENLTAFLGRIVKTMFAPYVFFFCYVILLYFLGH